MFEAYSHSNHEGLIAASCIEEVRFGSKAEYSPRVDVFRFAPDSGHASNVYESVPWCFFRSFGTWLKP
jgi:hypothetical protein